MIIDAHAHLMPMAELFSYRSMLHASNANHGYHVAHVISDDMLAKSAKRNVELMDEVGTDVQLLSARPFMLMHSNPNVRDVQAFAELNNGCIERTVKMYPDRFRAIGSLSQTPHRPVEFVFDEIDDLARRGFVGILLNPDPSEGQGLVPCLGDPYWYPLWEKLIDVGMPAHIHSAGCCGRETYDEHFATEESLAITSIVRERVFERYPDLKLMISHGGGSVPYQIGRWKAFSGRRNDVYAKHGYQTYEPFEDTLRRFYFDTCLQHKPSLELLFSVVGANRCLFGTERPGSGSTRDPETGRDYDDLKPVIESIASLTPGDRENIFENNARALFSRANF